MAVRASSEMRTDHNIGSFHSFYLLSYTHDWGFNWYCGNDDALCNMGQVKSVDNSVKTVPSKQRLRVGHHSDSRVVILPPSHGQAAVDNCVCSDDYISYNMLNSILQLHNTPNLCH